MSLARILFVLAALLFSSLSAAQTTVTLQQGLNGYTASADAWLWDGAPDTNTDNPNVWNLRNVNTAVVLKFAIFQSEGGPVPNGATITSATLSIYKEDGPDGIFNAQRLLRDWVESQVTWNSAATGAAWATPGALGTTDVTSTHAATLSMGIAAGWGDFDVTAAVQDMAAAGASYGWRLQQTGGPNQPHNFVATENTSTPTLRPKLAITYASSTCGSGALRPYDGAPVSGNPIPIASTGSTVFEAEHFNCGGEGVAYHDTDTVNDFPLFRTTEAVDINNRDGSTGYAVENFATGEWVVYTLNVPANATYDIAIRASNHWLGSEIPSFHLEIDGVAVTQSIAVPGTGSWNTYTWVTVPSIPVSAGNRVLKVVADQQWFSFDEVQFTFVSALSTCGSGTLRPYDGAPVNGNPIGIAATGSTVFEAENFDCGGEAVAYHDSDSVNEFGLYRTAEAVDINNRAGSTGYAVEDFATGEWVAYTLNVAASGSYDIAIRASNNWAGPGVPAFHLEVDGTIVSQSVTVPQTGSWNTYAWVTVPGVALSAGPRVLRVVSDQQWFSFDEVQFTPVATQGACNSGTLRPYDGAPVNGNAISISSTAATTFEAEHFDCGGEGAAYHDTDTVNDYPLFRTTAAVDINNRAGSTGYAVENFATGEWVAYTISVPADGSYDIAMRASNNWPGPGVPAFHIEIDGSAVTQSVPVPATGSWNTYTLVTAPAVPLTAGTRVLKVVSDQQWFSFDQLRITPTGIAGGNANCGAATLCIGFEGNGDTTFASGSHDAIASKSGSNTVTWFVQNKGPLGCDGASCDPNYPNCTSQPNGDNALDNMRVTLNNGISRDGASAIQLSTRERDDCIHSSNDLERSDLLMQSGVTAVSEGTEQWWGHSVYFPDNAPWPQSAYWESLFLDFHHTNSPVRHDQANFKMDLFFEPGNNRTILFAASWGLDGSGINDRDHETYQYSYSVANNLVKGACLEINPQPNTWYDFVHHIRWASDGTGFHEIWMRAGNGAPKKVMEQRNIRNLYPGDTVDLKLALYHPYVSGTSSVIHDRIRRGNSFAEVANFAQPNPDPVVSCNP